MPTSGFQLAWVTMRSGYGNVFVKLLLVAVWVGVLDSVVRGIDAIVVATFVVAISGLAAYIACHRVAMRSIPEFSLAEIYVFRTTQGTFGLAAIVVIFGALHDLVSIIYKQLRVAPSTVAIAVVACLIAGFVLFRVVMYRRIKNFRTRLAARTRQTDEPITPLGLSKLFNPEPPRMPPPVAVIGSGFAVFGAIVLSHSNAFVFVFSFVELMVLTIFMFGCISLTYEVLVILFGRDQIRALRVRCPDGIGP